MNHRFLDVKLRGASLPPAVEDAITSRLRAAIERGAVSVTIHVARPSGAGLRIDHGVAHAVHSELATLAGELGVPGPDLALVLAQPGVVAPEVHDPTADAADDTPTILAALDQALVQLAEMRSAEGRALERELTARLDDLARLRDAIAERAAVLPEQLARRLRERIARLLGDAQPDPARIAQEVALLADRGDVSEELVRIASHLEQARAMIAGAGPAGRRLDFLIQEIGRELNTIGSKAAATEISTAVVEAKAVLEKLREQVQNVE